jgi:carotenoid cleavage dioxygenase-like enzyme
MWNTHMVHDFVSTIKYTCFIHNSIDYNCMFTNRDISVAQEPEGSSPHSQQPATGPCPETVESNPHPPGQSP